MPPVRARLPLNVFGIAFGLTGLAGSWSEAARSLASPTWIAETLWAIAMTTWAVTVAISLSRVRSWRDIAADLQHRVLGPFAALIPIPPMLWGAHLVDAAPALGLTLIWVAASCSAVFGFWFIAQLWTVPRGLDTVHSGYFLPTVAAALLTGQSMAVAGFDEIAIGALGVGLLFWLLIGGVVLARLMSGPEPLGALLPTLGIFSAPPAVAGNAWWTLNGGQDGPVIHLLAGMMVAVVVPHLFLARQYARLPFALGFWALTFTAAASATFAMRLLSLADAPWAAPAAWVVLAAATVLIGAIAVRSVGLIAGLSRARRGAADAATTGSTTPDTAPARSPRS
jgi:tellurite resistance protein